MTSHLHLQANNRLSSRRSFGVLRNDQSHDVVLILFIIETASRWKRGGLVTSLRTIINCAKDVPSTNSHVSVVHSGNSQSIHMLSGELPLQRAPLIRSSPTPRPERSGGYRLGPGSRLRLPEAVLVASHSIVWGGWFVSVRSNLQLADTAPAGVAVRVPSL